MSEVHTPTCSLRADERGPQLARWREIARAASAVDYSGERITMALGPGVDAETVEAAIAVERECCPFFLIRHDREAGRLEMWVDDPDHAPALDAVAEQLGVSRSSAA